MKRLLLAAVVVSVASPVRADEAEPIQIGIDKIEQGDFAGARRVLQTFVAIPAHAHDAHAHFYLGVALAGLNDLPGAIREYRTTIQNDDTIAQAHANLGALLRETGDVPAAVRELCRAVQIDPGDGVAQYNLGLALRDSGRAQNAARAFRNAARLLPDDADPRIALGAILNARGDRPGAIAAFEEAARLAPQDPYPLVNLGLLEVDIGRDEPAGRHLDAARRLAGRDRDVLGRIAHGLRRLRRFDDAVEVSRAALAAGDPDPQLLCDLGLALKGAGKTDEAIAQFRAAVRLDATFAPAHYLLGNAYAAGEHWRDSAQAFERFLELAPNAPEATEARGRLEFVRGRMRRR